MAGIISVIIAAITSVIMAGIITTVRTTVITDTATTAAIITGHIITAGGITMAIGGIIADAIDDELRE